MNVRDNLHATLAIAALVLTPFAAARAAADAAGDANATAEPSIPFANHGGIRDWRADKDRGLWVQDVHGNWYYATLMGPCTGLDFAQHLAFDTRPNGSFDRWSAIIVPHYGRCAVQSLRPSGAPPGGQKSARAEQAKPKS
ncbi:MAG TPA: DUF6491 family protein [Steroidobacteraceae bacterium]|jgi:hypothetical protein|nr:DUF6491 family protein [Steroidobacteraceae bacterium]